MDAYALRLKTVSNNIANVGTEGYERKAVNFEKKLLDIMENAELSGYSTNKNHMPLGKEALEDIEADVVIPEDEFSNGINNVNIDHEMLEMGKVQINNSYVTRAISGLFGTLDAAIKGQRTR